VATVLLDVGGVIVLPDFTPVGDALFDQRQVANSALDRAHYRAIAALDRAYLTDSRDLIEAYVVGFLAALGVVERGEMVASAVETAFTLSWSRTIASSVDAMRKLGASGHRIVLVSNSLGHLEERLQGICQVGPGPGATVDAVIDSSEVGVEKPDPRIFDLALATVGGTRDDAVHVGDSIVYDVAGAQAAGIRAFHFDPWVSCAVQGHEHMRSLMELAAPAGDVS
jgi:putative hydrolase of the HAD superfamily